MLSGIMVGAVSSLPNVFMAATDNWNGPHIIIGVEVRGDGEALHERCCKCHSVWSVIICCLSD